MAGGKKARAKLKSGRLENRMRAGNGSDPTSQGGVGSSRPPRSQSPDSFEGVISREDVVFVKSAFETALSNENSYIQGRLKEEFPLMVYSLMEATPTTDERRNIQKLLNNPDGHGKNSPFSLEHRTLFRVLKVETQAGLLTIGSRIARLHGGAFQKMPVDLLGCLWNDSPAVSWGLFNGLEKHETFLRGPADADEKQKYKARLLANLATEAKAKPETLQALERRLDESYPGHSPSTPTPPSRAAAADDDDASGPPSLAPSEGDDDDETRDSRLPPSDAPFRNGETVTDDDDDDDNDDDDSSAPPSLATSSGSDDEEEDRAWLDRARFEEPPEEAENATRRTNPRASERPASSSASSSQPPSLASSPDSSRAASLRSARGAPASGSGNPGTRSFFSHSEALDGAFDPGEETKPSSSRDPLFAKSSSPDTNPTDPEAKKEDTNTFRADPQVPSQATPPQPRRKRFSEKVALARALARASVAKARRVLAAEAKKKANADESSASGSSSASPSSPSRSALAADRDAQLAYFRARREARDGGGGEASTSDSPWTRESRARRVREEASGRLGVSQNEKGSGTLFDLCDGVARRAVDDATHIEWLLNEPLVRRVWRYENTVRVCEFHERALRRDYDGRHVNDDEARSKNDETTPSRCFEAAPEVCGADASRAAVRAVAREVLRGVLRERPRRRGRARALLAQELRRGGRGSRVRPTALAPRHGGGFRRRRRVSFRRRRRSFVRGRGPIELEPRRTPRP
jgi:hypothetical protein